MLNLLIKRQEFLIYLKTGKSGYVLCSPKVSTEAYFFNLKNNGQDVDKSAMSWDLVNFQEAGEMRRPCF